MNDDLDQLDDAVALALGGTRDGDGWRFEPPLTMYDGPCTFIKTKRSFCRDWEYGGPIIERECIEIGHMGSGHGWQAALNPNGLNNLALKWLDGPTPLIAAMCAFVSSSAPGQVK